MWSRPGPPNGHIGPSSGINSLEGSKRHDQNYGCINVRALSISYPKTVTEEFHYSCPVCCASTLSRNIVYARCQRRRVTLSTCIRMLYRCVILGGLLCISKGVGSRIRISQSARVAVVYRSLCMPFIVYGIYLCNYPPTIYIYIYIYIYRSFAF